jgi:hypothetical protein
MEVWYENVPRWPLRPDTVILALTLNFGVHEQHVCGMDNPPVLLIEARPDYHVGYAGFVLDGLNITPLAEPGR